MTQQLSGRKTALSATLVLFCSVQNNLWASRMTPEQREQLLQHTTTQMESIQHTSEEARSSIDAQREERSAMAREHQYERHVGRTNEQVY